MSREQSPSAFRSAPHCRGELQAAVVAAYDGIRSTAEIGAMIGRSSDNVGNVLRRLNMPVVSKRADEARRAEYRACADEGMTIYECADRIGVSPASVVSMAKSIGLKFTPKKGGRPAAPHLVVAPKAKLSASPKAVTAYLQGAK